MLITETGLGGGWSGGAMVLGKLPVPGHPTIWITVGQGPTALARGAGKVGKKAGNTHICQDGGNYWEIGYSATRNFKYIY